MTLHAGRYADLDRAYGALATYVAQHALGVDGPVREYYVVSPLDARRRKRVANRGGLADLRHSVVGLIRYRARMPEIYGIRNGLNLDNLDVTTDDEINTFLTSARIGGHESVYGQRIIRGPLDPGPATT